MNNAITYLGYATDSITVEGFWNAIKQLELSKKEKFRRFIKQLLPLIIATTLVSVLLSVITHLILADNKDKVLVTKIALVGSIFFFVLSNIALIVALVIRNSSKEEILMRITDVYQSCIRDLVSIGSFEITNHGNYFLSRTQNWVNSDEKGKSFLKKIIKIREVPHIFNSKSFKQDTYEKYIEVREGFLELSAFVLKLKI